MAYVLNIESSTKNCSVAVSKNNVLLCLCEEYNETYSHSEKLHTFIQWALEGAGIHINQLDAIAVSQGPGSYTGLRIGVSAAKGLCFALNIPLLALESLDILVNSIYNENPDFIIPMLDARRMEVYTKIVDQKGVTINDTAAKILTEDSYQKFNDKSVIFVGNGAKKAKEILNLNRASFLPQVNPSAKNMIELSYQKFKQQSYEDIAYFEPFYLKNFIAGTAKNPLL